MRWCSHNLRVFVVLDICIRDALHFTSGLWIEKKSLKRRRMFILFLFHRLYLFFRLFIRRIYVYVLSVLFLIPFGELGLLLMSLLLSKTKSKKF